MNLKITYRIIVNPSLKLGGVFGITIVAAALFRSNLFQIRYPGAIGGLVFFIFLFNHVLKFHPKTPFHFNLAANKHR